MGNALEFYDFTVYAAFAVMLGRAFFPSSNPRVGLLLSVATFGVGFVARPLGGVVIGAYADRFGRRPAMTLTIWLMALGTGMIGLLPTYDQIGVAAPLLLVFARLVQGFSTGGEMGPATTYLLESAPADRKCFFGSWQLASQNIGGIISGTIGVVLALVMSPEATNGWGWRIPFLLGILIAPIGYYIRRNLDETLAAEEAHDSMSGVLSDVLRHYWVPVLLCILVISGATITQYFFIYTTTYAITTLHYGQGIGMAATLTASVVGAVFAVVGGLLADRHGLKVTSVVTRLVVTVLLYPGVAAGGAVGVAGGIYCRGGVADGAACDVGRSRDRADPEDIPGDGADLGAVDCLCAGGDAVRRHGAGGVHLGHRRDRRQVVVGLVHHRHECGQRAGNGGGACA